MAKKRIGKFIFRRIRGRLVPIRIKNVRDPASGKSFPGVKERKIVATGPKGEFFGQLSLRVPKRGKHAEILDVRVNKDVRRKGISRVLFKKAAQFSERVGKKFIRSSDVQSPAQVKIRRAFGKSIFTADQFPPFGEVTKKVSSFKAIRILKDNTTGRTIQSTTKINEILRKRKKK